MVENQPGRRITKLHTDSGHEFINCDIASTCSSSRTIYQHFTPYPAQQDSHVERMNRTLMEMPRAMLHYRRVDLLWRGEAVYINNRSQAMACLNTTSYMLYFIRTPSLEQLFVFGSMDFTHVEKENRTKLDPKAFKCVPLGYSE